MAAPGRSPTPVRRRQARQQSERGARGFVDQRLREPSKGDGVVEALDGFVAEGDIEGLRLLRVRADERREGGGTCIAFNTAPDGVHIGSDGDQFGEVAIELAVVVR